jgi:hypothetical protein
MGTLYAGVAGIGYQNQDFELGEGIIIRSTYAHLFAPYMMAFKPPGKYKHHDGPWKPAKGGITYDILIEIEVPETTTLKAFSKEEIAWLIVSLIKISDHPYVSTPILSDISFNRVVEDDIEPTLIPNEVKRRIFRPTKDVVSYLSEETLLWIKGTWKDVATLMTKNPQFNTAYKAFDTAGFEGSTASSLITIWGAIEQLFSSNSGELRYRVASNLAAYLEAPGEKRLDLYKRLLKLYNERSTAAHTSKPIEQGPLLESYVYLRNALIKIIQTDKVPTATDFEEKIFKGLSFE